MHKKTYRRKPGLERADIIFPHALREMSPKVAEQFDEHLALCHWEETVGPHAAKKVKPVAIQNGCLLLVAESSSWQNELALLRLDIMSKLNRFVGRNFVRSIRFVPKRKDVLTAYEAYNLHARKQRQNEKEQDLVFEAYQQTSLSEAEQNRVQEMTQIVDDPDLRKQLASFMGMGIRLKKAREKAHFHLCQDCGRQIEVGTLCLDCRRKHREAVRQDIRKYLREIPWATFAELQKLMYCTPSMVERERKRLVQIEARKVRLGDEESLEAKALVMLYRAIKPSQLTPAIIHRALRELQQDLARPQVFTPLKQKK